MATVRPLVWVGRSKKDYLQFPPEVRAEFGQSLLRVQAGWREVPLAKPLAHGLLKGLGIFELAEEWRGDAYRAVYTVKLNHAGYVLHAFKKKSRTGIATPKHEMDVIRKRFDLAVALDRQSQGEQDE
jgi:phage-related protein